MNISTMSDNDVALKFRESRLDKERSAAYAEALFNRFHKRGFNIARYYGLSKSDAQDAVQTAFIKAFHSISSYKPQFDFSAWFFKIVVNCSKDVYRKHKKHYHAQLSEAEEIADHQIKKFDEKLQDQDLLQGIINELPEKLKRTLLLRIYGSLTIPEISSSLGVSERQVHNRLSKAYELLRESAKQNGLEL